MGGSVRSVYFFQRGSPVLPIFVLIYKKYIYIHNQQRPGPSNKDSTPPGWDAEVDSWQTNLSHAACPWGGRLVKVILSDVDVRDAPERKSYMLVPCMQQLECLSWITTIRTVILKPRGPGDGHFPSVGHLFCRNIRGVRALQAPKCLKESHS